MKTSIIALALGAALFAPPPASAEVQSAVTLPLSGTFLIVDAESGRTIATLVPAGIDHRTFRMIGAGASPAPRADASAPRSAWLTPGQLEALERAEDRVRFYTPPDAG